MCTFNNKHYESEEENIVFGCDFLKGVLIYILRENSQKI